MNNQQEVTKTVVVEHIKKTFTLSAKQRKINKTKEKLKIAVSDVSFETYPKEIFGLLGPNGAGKTTTLRCISTLIKPDQGKITIAGHDIKEEVEVKKHLGFLTNELKLEDQMTPSYAFDYFARFYNLSQSEIAARKKMLFERFDIIKFSEVKIGDLSTGMKQKVSIVVSLAHDPEIIIFDEPTNGLDVITAKVVTDFLLELKEQGKTIIISTHIMGLAEKLCDRVGIIIDGKMIVCDTLANVRKLSPSNDLEDVFFELYVQEKGEKE